MSEHFNTGNKYAVKPPESVASAKLSNRVTVATKTRWKAQAKAEGLNLTKWMQRHLDAVCDEVAR